MGHPQPASHVKAGFFRLWSSSVLESGFECRWQLYDFCDPSSQRVNRASSTYAGTITPSRRVHQYCFF
jgi:hypothetical protein